MFQTPTQQVRQMEPVIGTGGQGQLSKAAVEVRWRLHRQPKRKCEAVTLCDFGPQPLCFRRGCRIRSPEIRSDEK